MPIIIIGSTAEARKARTRARIWGMAMGTISAWPRSADVWLAAPARPTACSRPARSTAPRSLLPPRSPDHLLAVQVCKVGRKDAHHHGQQVSHVCGPAQGGAAEQRRGSTAACPLVPVPHTAGKHWCCLCQLGHAGMCAHWSAAGGSRGQRHSCLVSGSTTSCCWHPLGVEVKQLLHSVLLRRVVAKRHQQDAAPSHCRHYPWRVFLNRFPGF